MKRKVNFGIWYDLRNPQPAKLSFSRFYDAVLEQIHWAEAIGLDSVWLTEHHFCDDGYTPSPLIFAAAIARSTSRISIGTNLLLAPLYHPIRLAEDTATLSLLSGGRFALGIGAGYVEQEYRVFDRQLNHRPSLIEECVNILRQAWSGTPVSCAGKRFTFDKVAVRPLPEQPPPILLGAVAQPAIERAARIADGFLSSGGVGHNEYTAALASTGKADLGRIYAGCWGIVCEDPDQARAELGDCILRQMNGYIQMGAFGGTDGTPLCKTAEQAIELGFYEFWTPEVAVTRIIEILRENPRIVDLHFWAQFPGEPIESGSRRIKLLVDRVLPAVRTAIG